MGVSVFISLESFSPSFEELFLFEAER